MTRKRSAAAPVRDSHRYHPTEPTTKIAPDEEKPDRKERLGGPVNWRRPDAAFHKGAMARLAVVAALLDAAEGWQYKGIDFDALGQPIGLTVVDRKFDGPALVREGEDLLALLPRQAEREEMLRAMSAERAFRRASLPYIDLGDPRRDVTEQRLADVEEAVSRIASFDPDAFERELNEAESNGETDA